APPGPHSPGFGPFSGAAGAVPSAGGVGAPVGPQVGAAVGAVVPGPVAPPSALGAFVAAATVLLD
ncbi:hypothetical protein ACMWQD_29790, partial [Escherichia coli]